jgi:hypothetical protein
MADRNPVSFLLNQGTEATQAEVVEAPAFSLTKVLASAAIVVTPIATALVAQLKDVTFTAGNFVALAIGVLGFLAITASADVLARALATSAEKTAQAAVAGLAQLITFEEPLDAMRIQSGEGRAAEDAPVEVLASAYAGEPYFLTKKDATLTWEPASTINIKKRT